jgi:hypothetical protein
MANRTFDNSTEFAISTTGQTLTSNNAFRNRWSENVVESLRQSGVLNGRFAAPSDTPPVDTSLIWTDTSAQTAEGQEPPVYRFFNSGTMTWDPASFVEIWQAASGAVNVDAIEQAGGVNITSSAGTGGTIALATGANAGVMSPADKQKLDGIASGAEVNVQADWAEGDTGSDAFIQNKPDNIGGFLGTSLGNTPDADSVLVTSSSGTDTDIPSATQALAGVMSAADKTALDNAVTQTGNNTFTGTNIFDDDGFTLQDDADNTKRLNFQLSGLTTSTTRTLTVPDADDTVMVLGLAQTVTGNKTFSGTTTLSGPITSSGTFTTIHASGFVGSGISPTFPFHAVTTTGTDAEIMLATAPGTDDARVSLFSTGNQGWHVQTNRANNTFEIGNTVTEFLILNASTTTVTVPGQFISGTDTVWNEGLGNNSETAANIASSSATINTQNKFQGKQVYDTTNNRIMVADGSGATSLWYVADGSASVTPA